MSAPANAPASAAAPEPALAPAFAGADAEARPAGGIALEDAYRHCARLARSHYENFNVGGCVTPKDKLPHIYAIYAWCRTVDDLGDEAMPAGHNPGANHGDSAAAIRRHRLGLLDWWQSELDAVYGGGRPEHPASIAVQHTVGVFDIPRLPFDRLIHANRIDQGSGRFATREDVLEYCQYSANPVGHLYLYLFGYADAERRRRADCTCTALQLTNFWQDVARDYRERNRIYLPQADLARYGVRESDIAAGNATPAFRALLREHCDLARELFREGRLWRRLWAGRRGCRWRCSPAGAWPCWTPSAARITMCWAAGRLFPKAAKFGCWRRLCSAAGWGGATGWRKADGRKVDGL